MKRQGKKKIFISYSHQDETWKERLVKHLLVAELEEHYQVWDDRQIQAGDEWMLQIVEALEEARLVIFIVSADFLISGFIRREEIPRTLERCEREEIRVIPLLVKPCAWKTVPWLSALQIVPKDAKALSEIGEEMGEAAVDKELAVLTEWIVQLMGDEKEEAEAAVEIKSKKRKDTVLLTPLPMRSKKLLGRGEVLKDLVEKLFRSDRVLLVNGMGGIGKTEVCKKFFLDHYREFSYAAWVDYELSIKDSLVTALGRERYTFIQTRKEDTLDDRFERIMERLYRLDEDSILIVDNIQHPGDEDLDKLLRLPFKVIANSRSVLEGFEVYGLDVLSPVCCSALFYEHYLGEKDDHYVEKIVDLCGRHTLSVELLARTAWNAGIEIKELYDLLLEKGFNLNGVIPEKVLSEWHDEKDRKQFFDHLLTVFDMSDVTDEELDVLINLSVLPADVPLREFCQWIKLKSKDVINGLLRKGWLKREGKVLFMHNLIQEVIRYRTSPNCERCKNVIDSLGKILFLEPHENPITKQPFLRFGDSLLRHIENQDKDLATLENELSHIYWHLGSLSNALKFQKKALTIREGVLDKNHPDLAESYNNLSLIYQDMGDFINALKFQSKATRIFEEVLDKNHPSLATSYNNLSLIYQAVGDFEKAIEFQLKDIEISRQILDKNHPSLATSYNNLSLICQAVGDFEEALKFQREATRIWEKVLDKNHPSLATSYNNLSTIYHDLGDFEKALEFQRKALTIREDVFDKNHPDLAQSYNNLSTIYRAMGDFEKALEFQKKATKIWGKILDKNHYYFATSYNNLSTIYKALGDLEQALVYAEKAVSILQHLFPNGHPNLETSKKNLGIIRKEIHRG